jgi:hypothetical protein
LPLPCRVQRAFRTPPAPGTIVLSQFKCTEFPYAGVRPRCGAGFQPAQRFVTAAGPLAARQWADYKSAAAYKAAPQNQICRSACPLSSSCTFGGLLLQEEVPYEHGVDAGGVEAPHGVARGAD